jgi:hypothetical protein
MFEQEVTPMTKIEFALSGIAAAGVVSAGPQTAC